MGIDKMDREKLYNLCSTFIYSDAGDLHREAKKYMTEKLRRPDKGSDFEKSLGVAKYLLKAPVVGKLVAPAGLWYLQRGRRDALMLELEKEIIGHTAFQVHKDNSLHVFSVETNPDYRLKGLAGYMVEKVLDEARNRKIDSMRIGGGNSEATNRIHRNFSKRAEELGILAREKNWIDIL